jgi:hypothetical protein
MIKTRAVCQVELSLEPAGTLTSTMGWNGLSVWYSLMIRRSSSLLTRMRKRINGSVLRISLQCLCRTVDSFFLPPIGWMSCALSSDTFHLTLYGQNSFGNVKRKYQNGQQRFNSRYLSHLNPHSRAGDPQ